MRVLNMELLVLLFLSPVIIAQNYKKNSNPNNEPFLPIYPVFPYSPKLIKRGTERDVATPGTRDSYALKPIGRDSYSPGYGGNFQKEQYYSPYNAYPKTPSTPFSPFSSSFSANPFSANLYGSTPFPVNPFLMNPYNSLNSFSNAYQNSPLSQPPPSPFQSNAFPNVYQPPLYLPNFYNQYPPPSADYPNRNTEEDDDNDKKSKKSGRGKTKEDSDDSNDNQFTNGANSLSSNDKDLDTQSTTGQSSSLDYSTNSNIKHQLEQLMRQTLIKLLVQNLAQQTNQVQQHPVYESNLEPPNQNIGNKGVPSYVSTPNVIAKTGLSYVVNPSTINKPNNQITPSQVHQSHVLVSKNQRYPESRYQDSLFVKPPGVFYSSVKTNRSPAHHASSDYGDFEAQPSQTDQQYQASSKQEQRPSYGSQSLVTPTPESTSYQYTSYKPTSTSRLSDDEDSDDISINFSSKQKV